MRTSTHLNLVYDDIIPLLDEEFDRAGETRNLQDDNHAEAIHPADDDEWDEEMEALKAIPL